MSAMAQSTSSFVPRVVRDGDVREVRPERGDAREARRSSRRMRLTARGRRVLTTLLVLLALAAGTGAGLWLSDAAAASDTGSIVRVEPGESLWGVADRYKAPGASTEDAVHELRAVNNLPGPRVTAGTELTVPADLGD